MVASSCGASYNRVNCRRCAEQRRRLDELEREFRCIRGILLDENRLYSMRRLQRRPTAAQAIGQERYEVTRGYETVQCLQEDQQENQPLAQKTVAALECNEEDDEIARLIQENNDLCLAVGSFIQNQLTELNNLRELSSSSKT